MNLNYKNTCLIGWPPKYEAEDLGSHDFDYCLVCYQNLPTSRIWLDKSMAKFLPNFSLPNSWHDKFWP
jgi:hypothetical protein